MQNPDEKTDMRFAMSGNYNANAQYQHELALGSVDFLAQAAAIVPIAPGSAFKLADLGASHGVNSVQPVKAVLGALAARTPAGQTQEVAVYHEDLPSNDFAQLLNLINDPARTYLPPSQQPGSAGSGGGGGALAVYPYVIARSYYERLFPSSSIHLTFAFTTLHYLSIRPVENTVSFFPHDHPDPEFRAAFTAQALSDLTSFLELRAAETVPGGALVAHFSLRLPDTQKWRVLLQQVVQEHLEDGRLLPDELANMASFVFLRSQQDVLDALRAVERLWTVKHAFARLVADPLAAQRAAGELSIEQAAEASCTRIEAVLQGGMEDQLTLTRGRDEAKRVIGALFADFRAKMVASGHEPEAGLFQYLYLERTAAAAC